MFHMNTQTEHTKRGKCFCFRFLGEYTLFLTNFSKNYQGKSREQRKKTKLVGVMEVFLFSLLTISYHGN